LTFFVSYDYYVLRKWTNSCEVVVMALHEMMVWATWFTFAMIPNKCNEMCIFTSLRPQPYMCGW
jgi:hypothetical protein